MVNSKRIRVRTVTFERLVLSGRQIGPLTLFCGGCEGPSEMMTISDLSLASGIRQREIFRLVEGGRVHSLETDDGQILVCSESAKSFNKEKCDEK
jgi:hypothetical protein